MRLLPRRRRGRAIDHDHVDVDVDIHDVDVRDEAVEHEDLDEPVMVAGDDFPRAVRALSFGPRAGRVVVWAALAAAVCLSLWSALAPRVVSAGGTSAGADTTAAAGDDAGAGGWAALYVAAWLDAGVNAGEALLVLQPDAQLPDRDPHSFVVSSMIAVAVSAVDETSWSVTVQGLISEATGTGSYTPPVLRCYRVTVAVGAAGGLRAVVVPAQIACTASADAAVEASYPDSISTGPVLDVVTAFFTAYLTGSGDVSLMVSPGSVFTPMTTPAYASITVRSVRIADDPVPPDDLARLVPGDGSEIRVLAGVDASTSGAVLVPMQYPLSLRARGGRWEIAALDEAPVMTPAPSASQTAPPTSTSAAPPPSAAPTS